VTARTETEGVPLRRLAGVLSVISLVLCGLFVWLRFARGVAYVGPVPTFAFWMLPGIAGSWLAAWPQRRTPRGQVGLLAATTAFVLTVLVFLMALFE
jgi:hypothetical protein